MKKGEFSGLAHGKGIPIIGLLSLLSAGRIFLQVELVLVMVLLYFNIEEFSGFGHCSGLCLMLVRSEMTVSPLAQIWPIQFVPYSLSQEVLDLESISIHVE